MASISRKRVSDSDVPYSGGVSALSSDEQDEMDANPYEAPEMKRGHQNTTVSSGWGAPKQERRERVQAPYLKLHENGKRIVKLLTESPSLNYFEHFVNSTGKRYICPGRVVCALCKAGHKASYRFMMNVVDMGEPEVVCTWTFGNEVAQQLQAFAEDEVTSPLDRENLYFQVYHIKVEGRKAPGTKVLPLKARDLQEDYNVEPLTESEIAELSENLYGNETLFFWSDNKIEEAAQDLTPKDLPKQ